MTLNTEHADFINEQLEILKGLNKWRTQISNTEHVDIINDLNIGVFKIASLSFFKNYLDTKKCECGSDTKEICYGNGLDRTELIKKTLKKVYPDITVNITLKELLIAYFEEHKHVDLTFKCRKCVTTKKTPKEEIYTIDDKEYIVQKVAGDGHCFFHAIALHLNCDVEELRNSVADYMVINENDFIDCYEPDEHDDNTFEQYVENIRSTDEWADQLVIQATQKVLNRPIKVYRKGRVHLGPDINVTIECRNQANVDILVLFNDDNHYDGLIEKYTDNDSKPNGIYQKMVMANGKVLNLHLGDKDMPAPAPAPSPSPAPAPSPSPAPIKKILTKQELQSMSVPDIKALLESENIRYNKKDKKTRLINVFLRGLIFKKNTERAIELNLMTNKALKEILDKNNIPYDIRDVKLELVKAIINCE
jgi:hypothetical protein